MKQQDLMDKVVSLAKRRGFIFPSAEIYGGLGSVYDYGPLGTMMKQNLRQFWMEYFVYRRSDIVPIESAILTRREVLQASGHEAGFSDSLVECKKCHERFRADHEIPQARDHKHELTEPQQFNLMFKTQVGPVEDTAELAYLRPETAQGIFVNFKLVAETMRKKPPFGIAQIGKAFRNEITVGNFIFRLREFEQAEIEFFVPPQSASHYFEDWIKNWQRFFEILGLAVDKIRLREHSKEELSHYSQATTDIEYEFPFGWSELAGIANRGDYDLKQHIQHSGKDLSWFDEETKEKYVPFVIEPTLGLDRLMMALLVQGFYESDGHDERKAGEVVLKLPARIAPVKVAVFPLIKKESLPEKAQEIVQQLRKANLGYIQYDESGSIGRRYRRQDEIGTPWCVTVDFDSLSDNTVTVRDRDSLQQKRVGTDELIDYFHSQL